MLSNTERRLTNFMLRYGLWVAAFEMRIIWIKARTGTAWMLRALLNRQSVDDLGHAPCCPANHYHRTRLVFQSCNCGATKRNANATHKKIPPATR